MQILNVVTIDQTNAALGTASIVKLVTEPDLVPSTDGVMLTFQPSSDWVGAIYLYNKSGTTQQTATGSALSLIAFGDAATPVQNITPAGFPIAGAQTITISKVDAYRPIYSSVTRNAGTMVVRSYPYSAPVQLGNTANLSQLVFDGLPTAAVDLEDDLSVMLQAAIDNAGNTVPTN